MDKVSYFALVRLDVGDGHRNPGDLVPEARDWARLNSYIQECRLAPVLTETLPDSLKQQQQDFEDGVERSRKLRDVEDAGRKAYLDVINGGGTEDAAEEARRLAAAKVTEDNASKTESKPLTDEEDAKRRLKAAAQAEKDDPDAKKRVELIEEDEANPKHNFDAEGNDLNAPTPDEETEPPTEDGDDDTNDDDDDGEGKGPDDGDIPPYTEWKKAELQEELLERGIDYPASANKPELVALLEANDAEEEAKNNDATG